MPALIRRARSGDGARLASLNRFVDDVDRCSTVARLSPTTQLWSRPSAERRRQVGSWERRQRIASAQRSRHQSRGSAAGDSGRADCVGLLPRATLRSWQTRRR